MGIVWGLFPAPGVLWTSGCEWGWQVSSCRSGAEPAAETHFLLVVSQLSAPAMLDGENRFIAVEQMVLRGD